MSTCCKTWNRRKYLRLNMWKPNKFIFLTPLVDICFTLYSHLRTHVCLVLLMILNEIFLLTCQANQTPSSQWSLSIQTLFKSEPAPQTARIWWPSYLRQSLCTLILMHGDHVTSVINTQQSANYKYHTLNSAEPETSTLRPFHEVTQQLVVSRGRSQQRRPSFDMRAYMIGCKEWLQLD